jgi:GST-like protein
MRNIQVIGCKGCGSIIAEAFLTLGGLPFDREEVDYDEQGPGRDRLLALNPLAQVPTLVLADGSILTETLAIAEYVNTRVPSSGLIPVGGSERTRFWRWATFIVAAIYPTFTYGDSPGKWVANAEGRAQLRASTDSWRQKLFSLLEAECQSPYFLGDTFSAIDVYLAAMVHWRPRRPWFDTNAPRVAAVAGRIESRPELAELFAANFD